MRKLFVSLLLAAAATSAQAATQLTVITHDSFSLDKKLVAAFEKANNVRVRFIKGGDTGEMLNKLILSRKAPLADVVYGIDNTLQSRAFAADLLEPYPTKALAAVPARLRMDPGNRLHTVDFGYVALNYDRAEVEKRGLKLPGSLEDFTRPEYRGLLVVPSAATSSPGQAFMLATFKHFGEAKALQFWADLRKNGLKVTRGWSDAYYTEFSKAGGSRPFVVSYATSPAAEVFYSEKKLTQSPTANLFLPGSTFLQLEGVGVLKGAKQPALARKFVDFMLSREVQSSFPTELWVYPAREGVKLDPVFRYAQRPPAVAQYTPEEIAANAQRWTDLWVKVVVRGMDPAQL
ncbi:thiamine transport system substrate-binding protein [Deinobacterium chartae]|uniref:Thiamine transport system substrate-binding protein n=1 Tax=Deinobacterium chartae TaxID=521158 RepID=A0A841HW46_9DEIO|nr:thiamine ABC transporter substrate-binding protein [Deinobacterium chartae]MBB6097136.1 thiamine transport system substrate-binding protein [Deinobacterium chartae]